MAASSSVTTWSDLRKVLPPSNTPGSFPTELLNPHESLLFETRPSLWGKYWPGLLFFGFFFVALVGISPFDGSGAGGVVAGVIVFGLPLALLVLLWYRTVYALSDSRVLVSSGLFSHKLQSAAYDEVQELTVGSGSTGNLVFETGTGPKGMLGRRTGGGQKLVWSSVPLSSAVYQYVQSAFGIRASAERSEQIRAALIARQTQNSIPCAYCGGLVSLKLLDLSAPSCPRCGAPLVVPQA